MRDAVICEPIRTAVGGYGGTLKDLPAADLAATVIRALVERTKITSADIDDVIFGQCYPNGEAPAIGRVAVLDAGLDISVPGIQIDRRCGSGLQAVINASMYVQTGAADLVIAGGAESMSQAEYYVNGARWGLKGRPEEFHCRIGRGRVTSGGKNYPVPGGMLETAENLRRDFGITRDEQDAFAVWSHQKAAAATREGKFKDELVPVELKSRKGTVLFETDEHIRADATVESLGSLRPIMGKGDPEATVTAGNASGQNDAAAACIVTTMEKAEKLGLNDMDLIELNEAFAAQVIACLRSWGVSNTDERLNVNGSGISLGHPVGATGVRILANLLREMERRGSRYGIETMCIGGGQGLAAIFERVA